MSGKSRYKSEKQKINSSSLKRELIEAPKKMCILGPSIKETLAFFRELRREENWSKTKGGKPKIEATLKNVEEMDYASISILTAISENLKKENKRFSFIPPVNRSVRKKLFFSGMLNHFYNEFGGRSNVSCRGELINLKNGFGKLKVEEIKAVMDALNRMVEKIHYPQDKRASLLRSLRSVILEICGNAIEWGYGRKEKKWILGIWKESDSEFIVTFTDIGDGILKTLNRKPQDVLLDFISLNNNSVDILKRAFEKKYGSSTSEPNRNRGLPMIKKKLDEIENSNLRVLTNDALLDFKNFENSKNLKDIQAHFHGTFYQWSICYNGN